MATQMELDAMPATQATPADRIRQLARAECDAFAAWQESDEQHPPTAYYTAVENLLQNYSPTEVPVARNSMQRLADAYRAYLHDTTRQTPNQEFWAARSMAMNDLFRLPPPPLQRPLPAEMAANKVGPMQIGYEWMILKEDGKPDYDRVMYELANPGSVVTPEYIEWRHQQDLITLGFVIPEPEVTAVKESYKPPVQPRSTPNISIEDMIRSRMPFDQIFNVMKRRYDLEDVDDLALRNMITAFADMMNVPLINVRQILNDAGHADAVQLMGEDIANAPLPTVHVMDQTPVPSPVEPVAVEPSEGFVVTPGNQEVIQLFTAGHSVNEIAKATGLSKSEVKRTIDQAQQ